MEDNFSPKIADLFFCEKCDYKCCKKCDFNKHLLTLKHQKDDAEDILDDAKIATKYFCECGKEYKHRQGLWKHKKKCQFNTVVTAEELSNQITPELILSVLHQNKELQTMLIEQNKTIFELSKNNSNTNISNNNINSNNKSFNLNFFLNETCKDAMNIMDFVDSLKLQLSDLENMGNIGYIDGISKIIVRNLNLLDETK